ncbi:twin-arginine translocation signal domain-containing protein [Pollutimonas sp. M17]|uniref:twin-arginine translocation signal domain-containing protein n=1 Tax=Pollutimonas sp. M17 TaxID=2962065 RepID=UPI0021F45D2E|nr:twin-arginine translocation signal domain-containing protein [Pollutimonas sp. M17]UYO93117.1 twin-arginine translocation signal domain-containing protein [Pollutimonas sp. M17]
MEVTRRNFVKGCAAACVLLLPGVGAATQSSESVLEPAADSRIEKSIKAGFGGGFSVRGHAQTRGMTYADIEHAGNRYSVASADMLDWTIVAST